MNKNEGILQKLNLNPIENAWAIQDLTVWPKRSQIFWNETPRGLSYLLITGHPSQERYPMVILNDHGGNIESLFEHLPKTPYLIRETRASILEKIKPHIPHAKIYLEQRMDLKKENAKLPPQTQSRRLTSEDAPALAAFHHVPPHAADSMKHWIRGAVILAIFDGEKIVSMGSTVVRTEHVWDLAGIETLSEYRKRGYATDVVAALAHAAFEQVDTVSLTVLKDNIAALKTYSKLGFEQMEDRIWIDNGTGAKP
jgi:ribosomal protein S18 acetylase RimI-like enzyme